MTDCPPKAPRRNEYLKNGNFCRSVLLRLIAPKPDVQMATSPLDWPFLSCSDPWTRSSAIGPTESTSDLIDADFGLGKESTRRYPCGDIARAGLGRVESSRTPAKTLQREPDPASRTPTRQCREP